MRLNLFYGLFFVVISCFWGSSNLQAQINWLVDYSQAKEESSRQDKPIFMVFTGKEWCTYCIRLKDEVFDTPQFERWIEKNFIPLELDFPYGAWAPSRKKYQEEYTRLAQENGISGFPTIVVIQKGKSLGRLGYGRGGASKWIKNAEQVLNMSSSN